MVGQRASRPVAPDALDVQHFAEARLPELGYLSAVLSAEPGEDGRGPAAEAGAGGGLEGQSQALPRHLRRRTTSYKPRRMSVALKTRRNGDRPTAAPGEAERPAPGQGDGEGTNATRCRKHRRRPRVLLEARSPHMEALPAGAPARWLETHIWHAKRMHMAERWGFVLPVRSNRGPRAVVEASLKHCTLQDVTFLRPLEVCGPQGFLLELLAAMTDPLDEKARLPACVGGFVEATTTLYRANQFPSGCVAPVTVMWSPPGGEGSLHEKDGESDAADRGHGSPGSATRHQPREDVVVAAPPPARDLEFDEAGGVDAEGSRESGRGRVKTGVEKSGERVRRVWVWVHAAAAGEALEEIRKACLLEGAPWRGHLEVGPVKGGLARLRVRGRRAYEAMQKVVKVPELETEGAGAVDGIGSPKDTGASSDSAAGENNRRWTSMGSGSGVAAGSIPGNLLNGSIIALTALDPRDLPRGFGAEDEAVTDDPGGGGGGKTSSSSAKVLDTPAKPAPVSALWDPEARAATTEFARVRPDHVVNERRRQDRVRSAWDSIPEVTRAMAEEGAPIRCSKPGGARAPADTIPVLVINASGDVPSTHARGRSSAAGVGRAPADREFERKRRIVAGGWDLVLSAGWAPVFFHALYMAGARAISLGDAGVIALETGMPRFPAEFPDTVAGRDYWLAWGAERKAVWKRTRPKHRGFRPPKHLAAAAADLADQGRERSARDAKPVDDATPAFQPDFFLLAGGSRVKDGVSIPVAAEMVGTPGEGDLDPRESSLPRAAGHAGDGGKVSVERELGEDVRESGGGAALEGEELLAKKDGDDRQSGHAPAHEEDKEIPANQDSEGGPSGGDPAHEDKNLQTNRDGDGCPSDGGLAEGVENIPGKRGGDGRQSDSSPLPEEGTELPGMKDGDDTAPDDVVPSEREGLVSEAGGDGPHPCCASPREGMDLSVDGGGDGGRERDDLDGEEPDDAPHEQPVDEPKSLMVSPMEEEAPLRTSGHRERDEQATQRSVETDASEPFALARGFHYTKAFLPGKEVLPVGSSSAAPRLSLSIPTMLQVTLNFFKGVPQEGALVHAASEEHVAAWQRGKQDGHASWAGLPVTPTFAGEGSRCPSSNGLRAIGIVTTGGFSFLRGRGAGLAVCEALAVRDALMASAVVGRGGPGAVGDEGEGVGGGKRKNKKSSRRSLPTGLVLVRSSLGGDKGNWFRPATITLVE